jgi:hypothetical protein
VPESYLGSDTGARLEALGRVAPDSRATPNQVLSRTMGAIPRTIHIPDLREYHGSARGENMDAQELNLNDEHARMLDTAG